MTSTIIHSQDLSLDKLLIGASRLTFDERPVPALGGIPLIAKLGQGGMGAVYVGMHPRLKQEVAVKVLPFPLLAQKPEMVDRFFREAQIAAKIKSNHLVGVSDVNEESGLFYIVMEFVNGISAGGYLKQINNSGCEGLPESEALDICIAATEGLAAAHAEGIIHRDVKPDNILIPISKQGEFQLKAAKLADLGLARSEEVNESLTGTRTALGTPGFMAPEQCMDAKKTRMPADVFSMGATLFSLLTGYPPFKGKTAMDTLLATLQKPVTPIRQIRPEISPATATLIQRCLEKEAVRRHTDGTELLKALKSCREAIENIHSKPLAESIPYDIKETLIQCALPVAQTRTTAQDSTVVHGSALPGATHAPGSEPTLQANAIAAPVTPRKACVRAEQKLAAQAARPRVVLFGETPRERKPGIMAMIGIAAIASAGIAWSFWPRVSSTPPETQSSPSPVALVANTKALLAPPADISPPKTSLSKSPEKPELSASQNESSAAQLESRPTPILTDDQKRQAVTDAMPLALKAQETKDWPRIVELLNGPVITLGDLSHPARSAATELLLIGRTEIMKRADFQDKVKQAETLLSQKQYENAKTLFLQAKSLCPTSPEIDRADRGFAAAQAGLSEARYQIAMNEGNKAMDAHHFSDASKAFRRALDEKPGDETATEALRQCVTQATIAVNAQGNDQQPPGGGPGVHAGGQDGPRIPPPPFPMPPPMDPPPPPDDNGMIRKPPRR